MVTNFNSSCSHPDWCKFGIHLRSLKVHNFGMVKPTGFKKYVVKVTLNGMTSMLNLKKNPPTGSKVISGETQIDGWRESMLISQAALSFLKESRLKGKPCSFTGYYWFLLWGSIIQSIPCIAATFSFIGLPHLSSSHS
jgi:hypothetical protein